MYPALNMELEIVRTVLQNDVNDIYVCTDLLKDTGAFYTMISIHDSQCRKIITEKLNTERLLFLNSDYVGAFVYKNRLNIVFRYYQENLLSLMGNIYLVSFEDCKRAALEFLFACAQCGPGPEFGALLIDDKNINMTKDGAIRFNYFLDFAKFQQGIGEDVYLDMVARTVFDILQLNYEDRYESPEQYPDELRLFYLKMVSTGFSSIGHMISMIRAMSDKPVERRGIIRRILNRLQKIRTFLFHNSMTAFLTILVLVTAIYAGVQIHSRWKARKAYESNVSYNGIEYIGDVYLGDEE